MKAMIDNLFGCPLAGRISVSIQVRGYGTRMTWSTRQ